MKTSFEEQFITDFCNKIKVEHASKRSIAEQVLEAGYRLVREQSINAAEIATEHNHSDVVSGQATTAPDADGWIEWSGGECPVIVDDVVEVKFRDGVSSDAGKAMGWRWEHYGNTADIIAYRLHQPQDANSRANDELLAYNIHDGVYGHATGVPVSTDLESDLNDCIGQPQENITEIRGDMLEVLNSTGLKVNLNNAVKVVNAFIDAGYRKQ